MNWEGLIEESGMSTVSGSMFRIVESQEQIATMGLVDSLEEQSLLEQMIEETKPKDKNKDKNIHYLLSTPFRYPPLEWGSRFGSKTEESLFFGSKSITTLMCEAAYYRFIFWIGMSSPPSSKLRTQHTVLSIDYKSKYGAQLQLDPFVQYKNVLTDPDNYKATQKLGNAMRSFGIKAFEYISARDPEERVNVALFDIEALASKRPVDTTQWFCETDGDQVLFRCDHHNKVYRYPYTFFQIDGKIPQPAN
jgi:hypothetical protein